MRGNHRKHPVRTAIVSAASLAVVVGGLSVAFFSSSAGKASADTTPPPCVTDCIPQSWTPVWPQNQPTIPPPPVTDPCKDSPWLPQCQHTPPPPPKCHDGWVRDGDVCVPCKHHTPPPPPGRNPVACHWRPLTFNFPHGSQVLLELTGPVLRNGELANYAGTLYTLTDVHGQDFSVLFNGQVIINGSSSLIGAQAHLLTCKH